LQVLGYWVVFLNWCSVDILTESVYYYPYSTHLTKSLTRLYRNVSYAHLLYLDCHHPPDRKHTTTWNGLLVKASKTLCMETRREQRQKVPWAYMGVSLTWSQDHHDTSTRF